MLGACATLVDTRVKDMIRTELPRLVGPAERYDLDVSGARSPVKLPSSRRFAVGTRINRPKAPMIDRLESANTFAGKFQRTGPHDCGKL